MSYNPIVFKNGQPLNANQLNHIQTGITDNETSISNAVENLENQLNQKASLTGASFTGVVRTPTITATNLTVSSNLLITGSNNEISFNINQTDFNWEKIDFIQYKANSIKLNPSNGLTIGQKLNGSSEFSNYINISPTEFNYVSGNEQLRLNSTGLEITKVPIMISASNISISAIDSQDMVFGMSSTGACTFYKALEFYTDSSLILRSPNGTKFKLVVNNAGVLSTTQIN